MTGASLHSRVSSQDVQGGKFLTGGGVGPSATTGQLAHGFERDGVERFLPHILEDGQAPERGEVQIVGTDGQRASEQQQSQKVFQVFTVGFWFANNRRK